MQNLNCMCGGRFLFIKPDLSLTYSINIIIIVEKGITMKKLFFVLFLVSIVLISAAAEEAVASELAEWNEIRLNFQRNGMMVLGGWALANFAVSGTAMTQTQGQLFYFNQMNVLWNTVNVGIAGIGFYSAVTGNPAMPLTETLGAYHNFSKTLLFNAGLDTAYITAGFLLKEHARNSKHTERLTGYGYSLMLQGAFLLVFDITLVVLNEMQLGKVISGIN